MCYNYEMKKTFSIIIPNDVKPQPDRYEVAVARILADKFQSDILFIKRGIIKTPDVQVTRTKQFWEIKNIKGEGRFTIEDNLRKAAKQADNVVISLLRSKMTQAQAASYIQWYLKHACANLRRVILVTKNRKIIDF